MIAIDLSKNQAFDNDRKAMKLILLGFFIKWETHGKRSPFIKKQKKLFWLFHKEM